jgi:predicted small lipoprotein YifL
MKRMARKLAIKSIPPGLVLTLVGLVMSLAGCGLKGDLYFPEPQTQAEEDAVEAENAELESKEQPVGISN